MQKYQVLLIDADETLLDFKKGELESFKKVITKAIGHFDQKMFEEYEKINQGLWKRFEAQEISKEEVVNGRYAQLFALYQIDFDPQKANDMFIDNLSNCKYLIPNALEILEYLKDKYDLYCVTNGVKKAQFGRLAASGIDKYFKGVFVSEEVGYNKPSRQYFDHVFAKINAKKEECLIIGDSLSSDIKGGQDYGIDTCWFNFQDKPITDPKITYVINDLIRLKEIL